MTPGTSLIKRTTDISKACVVLAMTLIFLFTAPGGGRALAKVFTIGIVNSLSNHSATVDGFKAGMAELDYVEGKNVKYIYNGVINGDEKSIDNEIRKLFAQDIDLLVAVANEPAFEAKKITAGIGVPVIAAACLKMVEAGLVRSLKNPGGNITGVQVADSISKALEWFTIAVLNARKICLPYNPDEDISTMLLPELNKAASQLGIELVLQKIHTVEETLAVIETLPGDIDGIFRIPSMTLSPRNSELSQAAILRGLPMGASLPLDEAVLVTFASDRFETGRQTARLAHQIRMGVEPSDIPVESAEVFLTINLRTAEKIGINIPDAILMQAKRIIR